MAVSKDKISILLNIDKNLKEELTKLAKEDNRTLTGYITNVLIKHVGQTKS